VRRPVTASTSSRSSISRLSTKRLTSTFNDTIYYFVLGKNFKVGGPSFINKRNKLEDIFLDLNYLFCFSFCR
jgi:hypothetical protein